MHLGAQHEGSWGEEAMFAPSDAAAYDAVRALLQPGDVVRLAVEHIGELRHRITAAGPAPRLSSGY